MVRAKFAFLIFLLLAAGTHAYGEVPPSSPSTSEKASDVGGQENEKTDKANITPAPSSAAKGVLPTRESALKEWEFLKDLGKDTREERTDTALFQLIEFIRMNPDQDFSDEAQMLKSDLHLRKGDYKSATLDLLVLIYEYPNSRQVFQAKRTLTDLAEKKLDKKMRPVLSDVVRGSDAKEKAERLAQLLKKLSEQAGDTLYDVLVVEFDNFFCRFPAYAGLDEMNILFADMNVKKEKHLTAMTYYQKVLALFPDSRLRPRAQRSIGDLQVNYFKDLNDAVYAYQEVINQYPNSDETGYAYEQTAKLEEQLKHYDIAMEINAKIVKLYQKKDIALTLRAFNNEARILRDQMNKPDEAIQVLTELADMFKGTAGAADALKAASVLARKQKNFNLESTLLLRFVKECPTHKEAPDMLFQAALVNEEELNNVDQALDLFNQLNEKYADNKLAKKAKSHIDALMLKKFPKK